MQGINFASISCKSAGFWIVGCLEMSLAPHLILIYVRLYKIYVKMQRKVIYSELD